MKTKQSQLFDDLFPLIQDIAKLGVWFFDTTEKKLYLDDKLREMYEFDKDTQIETIQDIQQYIHPDEGGYLTLIKKMLWDREGIMHADFKIITAKGNTRYVSSNGKKVNLSPNISGYLGTQKDVTEKILLQLEKTATAEKNKELLLEYAKLSKVAEQTTNAVVITDTKGLTIWVNKSFEVMSGYSFAEVEGRKPGQILQGPETDAAIVAHMSEAILQQKGFEVEIINYSKDNKRYWIEIKADPYYNELGVFQGFIAVQADITERKKLYHKLKTERDKAQLLLDIAGSVIITLDVSGHITLLNRAGRELIHLSETADYSKMSWKDFIEAEDHALFERSFTAIIHSKLSLFKQKDFAVAVIDNLGERKYVRWNVIPLKDKTGKCTGILASGIDITERKKVKEELNRNKILYESVFHGSPHGILLTDTNFHFLDANKAVGRIFGYVQAQLIQNNLAILLDEESKELIETIRSDFSLKTYSTGIAQLRKANNTTIVCEFSATAEIVLGVHLIVVQDITEETLIQTQLFKQNEQLREIAWIQSHELRRPLANIMSLATLIAEKSDIHDPLFEAFESSLTEMDQLIRAIVMKTTNVNTCSI